MSKYCAFEVLIKPSYEDADVYKDVVVAVIEPRSASRMLSLLSDVAPLQQYGLAHLKRIRPLPNATGNEKALQVVVCPVKDFESQPIDVRSQCTKTEIISVCQLQPDNRAEFLRWGTRWPMSFHVSQLEKEREKGLSELELHRLQCAVDAIAADELEFLQQASASSSSSSSLSSAVLEGLKEQGLSDDSGDVFSTTIDALAATYTGGVIMNPVNGKIVAKATDGLRVLQRKHCGNRDSSNSGSSSNNGSNSSGSSSSSGSNSNSGNNSNSNGNSNSGSSVGVDCKRVRTTSCRGNVFTAVTILRDLMTLHTSVMLCIEAVASKVRGDENDVHGSLDGSASYLCTGFDIYLRKEPDLMSSMALVHSRIRRVFYLNADPEHGALESGRGHIHGLRSLNHHFRVFKVARTNNNSSNIRSSTGSNNDGGQGSMLKGEYDLNCAGFDSINTIAPSS